MDQLNLVWLLILGAILGVVISLYHKHINLSIDDIYIQSDYFFASFIIIPIITLSINYSKTIFIKKSF